MKSVLKLISPNSHCNPLQGIHVILTDVYIKQQYILNTGSGPIVTKFGIYLLFQSVNSVTGVLMNARTRCVFSLATLNVLRCILKPMAVHM